MVSWERLEVPKIEKKKKLFEKYFEAKNEYSEQHKYKKKQQ